MTRPTALPTVDDVQIVIAEITEATGKPPTVLALARHLGLANTTFRRHFPDITVDLHQQRSQTPADADSSGRGCDVPGVARFEQLKRVNAELRRANQDLAEHLDLAVVNIHRLTLVNHHLRHQLEAMTNVTSIDTCHRPGPPTTTGCTVNGLRATPGAGRGAASRS